jgi:hypothetical protein
MDVENGQTFETAFIYFVCMCLSLREIQFAKMNALYYTVAQS